MLTKELLHKKYIEEKLSMMQIAKELDCSHNRIAYWMKQYKIPRRSISDAIYQKANPNGDPFKIKPIKTLEDAKLFGLGIGLYWGEGTKASKYDIRLGNTDPELLITFIDFLIKLFGVNKDKLRFGLQIFTDINPVFALNYWTRKLDVQKSQFYKIHTTISGSIGTYRMKSKYGVVTVYFHNKKLRDILVGLLPR